MKKLFSNTPYNHYTRVGQNIMQYDKKKNKYFTMFSTPFELISLYRNTVPYIRRRLIQFSNVCKWSFLGLPFNK